MRVTEFISEEQKLDEVLPLIIGGAGLAAAGTLAAAGGVAAGVGGIASGVGSVAKGVGKGVGTAAKGVGKVVGAVGNKAAKMIDPKQAQDIDRAKDQLIRPGKKIVLPTQGPGGPQAFKVTKVQGDEVEIENPEGNKSPNQPNKIIYKKADVKNTIKI